MFILFVLIFYLYNANIKIQAQIKPPTQNIGWNTPTDCNSQQIFNPITLKCLDCENDNLIPNKDKSECICPLDSIPNFTDNSKIYGENLITKLQCIKCSKLSLSVSTDGLNCVKCENLINQETTLNNKCPICNDNEIVSLSYINENQSSNTNNLKGTTNKNFTYIERCVTCPFGTVPNNDKKSCVKCDNTQCYCNNNSKESLCLNKQNANAESIIVENNNDQDIQLTQLEYLTKKLKITALRCKLGIRTECQHLINLCVLQDYKMIDQNACFLVEDIRKLIFNSQQIIPNLFYAEPSVELSRESAIEGVFNFYEQSFTSNNRLEILSAVYSLNGTFLGLYPVNDVWLNICSKSTTASQNAFKFSRIFQQKCHIDIHKTLQWNNGIISEKFGINNYETIFQELYLRYNTLNGETKLYPIPVINENIRDNYMNYVNVYKDDIKRNAKLLLVKRFFLVDKQIDSTLSKYIIRIPKYISLHIRTQNTKDCQIYPPFLQIRYTHFSDNKIENVQNYNTLFFNNDTKIFDTEFNIDYSMESFKYDKTLEVTMGSLCSLSLLFSLVKAYSWGRRTGRLMIDTPTIIKFILFTCENISNVFLSVITIISIWIIYTYKFQKDIILLPLNYDQEYSFIVYIIIVAALNFIVLINNYITLSLVETFFIDWERPRFIMEQSRDTTMLEMPTFQTESLFSVFQKTPKKQNPVVIWRTYLIANEWNELQNYRKTSITIQLLTIIFFLEYLHFGDWAIIQPGFDRYNIPEEFSETRMSRFAINMSFYLMIGFIQWIVQVILFEKIIDPFRNFMDLCSIANISVLAMTHSLYGYYIHGRSVHGLADTDMQEMNIFLQREKENLCGLRGLENGSEIQTFLVSMPRAFRDRLDHLTLSLKSTNLKSFGQRGIDQISTKMKNTANVYAELNQFFKDMIDHVDLNCDYTITNSKFIEEMLGLELTDTSKIGNFVRDPSESAYSSVFLYGNEWIYMSFEALLFCLIDMYTNSRIFSSFLTYFVSTTIRKIAKVFFTNNLIRSSLVDNRFLI